MTRSLNDWLSHLETLTGIKGQSIELGLERVVSVAKQLDVLDVKNKAHAQVVTVAGTNGKGSFIAAAQQLLNTLPEPVCYGSYTSPHLIRFNERICIDGQPVSDAALIDAFERIEQAAKAVDAVLTYFEYSTLAAFVIFKAQALDVILLEIGLGGRLDAVNIIEPDWAVITSIGLDHQDFLGETLEQIAFEKAGIIRPQSQVIIAEPKNYAAFNDHHAVHQGRWIDANESIVLEAETLRYTSQSQGELVVQVPDQGIAKTSQAAAFAWFTESFASQFSSVESLLEQANSAFSQVQLNGRFQHLALNDVDYYLDVAHNAAAVKQLKARLDAHPLQEGAKRIAVFNMLKDKAIDDVIDTLKDDITAWFLVELDHPRAFAASDVAANLHEQGVHMISVSKNLAQALGRVGQFAQAGDQILIFGSFVIVGQALERLSLKLAKTQK